MRLPNGFGSISKLSGKRRNPYIVRITEGFDENGKQIFKTLGYVKSRKAGLEMLVEYHRDPNSLGNDVTFEDMYYKLVEKKEGETSQSTLNAYKSAFRAAQSLHKMKMQDIKLSHLESVLERYKDASKGTRAKYKNVYSMIFDLAIKHDLIDKNYAMFLEIGKDVNKKEKVVYTKEEIQKLWDNSGDDFIDATLILLYTGMRMGELVALKMENVHLDDQYFIGGSKTEAGKNRIIALPDKIMPLVRRLYGDGTKKQLVLHPTNGTTLTPTGFTYHWKNKMATLGITHGLHECRHSFISAAYKCEIPPQLIKKQVGHAGDSVTEKVYLHIDHKQLVDAVNKLKY